MAKIHVIDSIMGSGKTTAAINYINAAAPGERFIFITPYLSEVQRIKDACADKNFVEPVANEKGVKIMSLTKLIMERKNIVTTHALFMRLDKAIVPVLEQFPYTLFVDETLSVYETGETLNLLKSDTQGLMDRFLEVNPRGQVAWSRETDYIGRLSDIKRYCDAGLMRGFVAGTGYTFLFKVLSPEVLKAFEKVFILTYLLRAQSFYGYLESERFDYDQWYVADGTTITSRKQPLPKIDYRELINVCSGKINDIGKADNALSHGWYGRGGRDAWRRLGNALFNFMRNKMHSKPEERMWTTFVDYSDEVGGSRYRKTFVPCNTRATNDYSERTTLGYLVNRFQTPVMALYLKHNGVVIDNGAFALQEMLQWIWRSAIRNGNPITIYVPSKRMRDILTHWLDDTAEGADPIKRYAVRDDETEEELLEHMFGCEEEEDL